MNIQRVLASVIIASLTTSMAGCKLDGLLADEVDDETDNSTNPIPGGPVATIPSDYKSTMAFEVFDDADRTQYISTKVFYKDSDDTHLLTADGIKFEGSVETVDGRKTIIRPDIPTSTAFVAGDGFVAGENITLYGNYNLNSINQTRMSDATPVLSLNDSEVEYTGFGLKLPELVVNELDNSKSKIENYAAIYNKILIDSLSDEVGVFNASTLVDTVSQNAESQTLQKTVSVQLNGLLNPSLIASKAVDRLNNEVPVDLLQANESSTSKLYLQTVYWEDSQGSIYAWAGYYPADNYNAVQLTYNDLGNGSGLISTQ